VSGFWFRALLKEGDWQYGVQNRAESKGCLRLLEPDVFCSETEFNTEDSVNITGFCSETEFTQTDSVNITGKVLYNFPNHGCLSYKQNKNISNYVHRDEHI